MSELTLMYSCPGNRSVSIDRLGVTQDTSMLVASCAQRLAHQLGDIAALPRNALGKVQKHLLSAQLPPV